MYLEVVWTLSIYQKDTWYTVYNGALNYVQAVYMYIVWIYIYLQSRLHAWPTLSKQTFHVSSNSKGVCQNCGNCSNTVCFSSRSLSNGRPGCSRVPATVHCSIISSPKNASFASLTARVEALETVFSFQYFVSTVLTSANFSVWITEEGRLLSGFTLLISKALGATQGSSGCAAMLLHGGEASRGLAGTGARWWGEPGCELLGSYM